MVQRYMDAPRAVPPIQEDPNESGDLLMPPHICVDTVPVDVDSRSVEYDQAPSLRDLWRISERSEPPESPPTHEPPVMSLLRAFTEERDSWSSGTASLSVSSPLPPRRASASVPALPPEDTPPTTSDRLRPFSPGSPSVYSASACHEAATSPDPGGATDASSPRSTVSSLRILPHAERAPSRGMPVDDRPAQDRHPGARLAGANVQRVASARRAVVTKGKVQLVRKPSVHASESHADPSENPFEDAAHGARLTPLDDLFENETMMNADTRW
ncbi:hypothetical protein MSPP1_003464 [Malassezia sp. CBS 17886]|nr:hypothetical protein MSPP1_003464 [Malassezia sp. CBS 17886]